jgi:CHAT domain-containing protein
VVTAETPVRLFDLGPAETIAAAVRAVRGRVEQAPRDLRAANEKTVEDDYRAAAGDLAKLVFSPLQPALRGASLLFVAPDGELNRVAFQALVDADDQYLIERYRFSYVLTGRDLLRRELLLKGIPAPAPRPPTVAPRPPEGPRGAPRAPVPKMPKPGFNRPEPGWGTTIFAAPDFDLTANNRAARATELLRRDGSSPPATRGGSAVDTRGLRWMPLPGAAAEADDLKSIIKSPRLQPVTTYVGKDALEEVFKSVRPPRVLHVATHGFFLPDETPEPGGDTPGDARGGGAGVANLRKARNPLLRSGIVLAGANASGDRTAGAEDGLVTAEEIALMSLRGTDLVVLSACESGLGNVRIGEGVYGLRHAFLYAGARSLVTSLFEVPDAETRNLMRRFYEGLDAGRGKLDALHTAQLDMLRTRRKDKAAAHPFFWASFVLIGDPN